MILQRFFSLFEFIGSYNKQAMLPNRNTVIITFLLIPSFSCYDIWLQLISLFPHSSLRRVLRRSFQPNRKLRLMSIPFPYEEDPVIEPEMMSQPNVQKLLRDRMHGLLPHQRLLLSLLVHHVELIELDIHDISRQKALLRVFLLIFLVLRSHFSPFLTRSSQFDSVSCFSHDISANVA